MASQGKLERQHKDLVNKLAKNEEEIQKASLEVGTLSRTVRSDPSFSAARLENSQRDLARLTEQKDDLRYALEECELQIRLASIPHTPAQQEAMLTQKAKDERRMALQADLERTRLVMTERRAGLGKAIFEGGDPGELVEEVEFLERLERGLAAALEYKK